METQSGKSLGIPMMSAVNHERSGENSTKSKKAGNHRLTNVIDHQCPDLPSTAMIASFPSRERSRNLTATPEQSPSVAPPFSPLWAHATSHQTSKSFPPLGRLILSLNLSPFFGGLLILM